MSRFITFDLVCPFPGCNEILGDAMSKESMRSEILLKHICTDPCYTKKVLIEAERDIANKGRAAIKSAMRTRKNNEQRPTDADVDFVLDNYPGESE